MPKKQKIEKIRKVKGEALNALGVPFTPLLPLDTRVAAFDPALTYGWAMGTGPALTPEGPTVSSGVRDLRLAQNKPRSSAPNDYEKVAHIFNQDLQALFDVSKPDIIIAEMPPPSLKGWARIIIMGMHWTIRAHAGRMGVAMYSPSATQLKYWATGSGAASKERMMAATEDFGLAPIGGLIDDNHADALLLQNYGYERYVLGITQYD